MMLSKFAVELSKFSIHKSVWVCGAPPGNRLIYIRIGQVSESTMEERDCTLLSSISLTFLKFNCATTGNAFPKDSIFRYLANECLVLLPVNSCYYIGPVVRILAWHQLVRNFLAEYIHCECDKKMWTTEDPAQCHGILKFLVHVTITFSVSCW